MKAITMPFPMKIQPIDSSLPEELPRLEPVKPPAGKPRFKRLFESHFQSVLKSCALEKAASADELGHIGKEGLGSGEFEPSSVCLVKMVQNFMEDNNHSIGEKQSSAMRCGGARDRNRCNCFTGNCSDSSDDEWDSASHLALSSEVLEILQCLFLCASVSERNLFADTAKIIEKNKRCNRKDDSCRKIITDELLALGYDASICKSRWEKSSYPAGEYDYIDVIFGGERFIIDLDFRSEFETARSTKTYKSILQTLPYVYVGKSDRLYKIITIVSEAAKRSLKKKGMHIPPWRKAGYIKAKWLSPHPRADKKHRSCECNTGAEMKLFLAQASDLGLDFHERNMSEDALGDSVFDLSESSEEEVKRTMVEKERKVIDVQPRISQIGSRW